MNTSIELVALAIKEMAARCRFLGSDRIIILRARRLWKLVPGCIVSVLPKKEWRYGSYTYVSGEIQSVRIDVKALDLVPLRLEHMGIWDPAEAHGGEMDEPIEEWAKPIIAFGPRSMYEMEQVLPGEDPDDPFDDPIIQSNDLKEAGNRGEAKEILMELCRADLRCLDAHSHLGNLIYKMRPEDAIRHYEVGLRIGELSLEADFCGMLPWGHIDNRPFLRCMHGFGLCLWRLGRFDEADHLFRRMLWLNPSDNQGVRFLIEKVKKKIAWQDEEE